METTVYLIRHSEPLDVNNEWNGDSLQLSNEKRVLSLRGERLALELFERSEFENIDAVYASNYVRAISTARYAAEKNSLTINVVSDLGERKYGVSSYDRIPVDFEKTAFYDENYKMPKGESEKEVRARMHDALMRIISQNRGKRIVVVSHATAMAYLFKVWCESEFEGDYIFNGKIFFSGSWDVCQSFKLIFDGDDLRSIESI